MRVPGATVGPATDALGWLLVVVASVELFGLAGSDFDLELHETAALRTERARTEPTIPARTAPLSET